MKKIIKIIILLVFASVLFYVGYAIVSKINHKKEIAQKIKTMPAFAYSDIKGGVFTNRNLKQDTPTLFVYFNSDCDYCNGEAQMIQENVEKFHDFQLVFISFEKKETIKAFATKYKLISYDNIHFLSDTKVVFATTFDVKSMPSLVLYDRLNKLIEKIKGQTKIESVLKKLAS
jgi:peroxiredoxin